jgi:hypothetical protein
MKAWVLIGLIAATPAAAANFDGVYSNVCVDRETLDQGGMELRLETSAGRPTVVLKTCEGGCWALPVHDLSFRGSTISFLADDQDFDLSGKLVETHVHRFTGVFERGGLRLESVGYVERQRLGRVRFRGSVPASPPLKEWPGPVRRCR